MAEFCQECSIRVWGNDFGDFAGICKEGIMVWVLCEGCGYIWIDENGKRIEEKE